MKRVWKPLDCGGLRLYRVNRIFLWKPNNSWEKEKFDVLAKTPSHAAKLIQQLFAESDKENSYISGINYIGHALDVLMPESWWQDGVPCE